MIRHLTYIGFRFDSKKVITEKSNTTQVSIYTYTEAEKSHNDVKKKIV